LQHFSTSYTTPAKWRFPQQSLTKATKLSRTFHKSPMTTVPSFIHANSLPAAAKDSRSPILLPNLDIAAPPLFVSLPKHLKNSTFMSATKSYHAPPSQTRRRHVQRHQATQPPKPPLTPLKLPHCHHDLFHNTSHAPLSYPNAPPS